jgi:mono/diheme cytochrome c family protein
MKNRSIILISTALIVIVLYACKTQFTTAAIGYTATKSAQAFERGKVLVYSSCAGCHYNRKVNKFIGNRIEDVPGIIGKVYSANLTNSNTNGIPPRYSDEELKYLLKTGIAKDGRFISYMLRPNMADEDINAIVVYLRSDDPPISAADTTIGITKYNIIGKTFMGIAAKPLPYKPGIKVPASPVALGAYLADNIGCFHCHSKSLTSLNYLDPGQSKGYMAGGIKLKGENGASIFASNITPDKNTGIGNFTLQQFRSAVKEGQAPDRKLRAPMPKFDKLTDIEVDAIYAYLQTVPAKYHEVELH